MQIRKTLSYGADGSVQRKQADVGDEFDLLLPGGQVITVFWPGNGNEDALVFQCDEDSAVGTSGVTESVDGTRDRRLVVHFSRIRKVKVL